MESIGETLPKSVVDELRKSLEQSGLIYTAEEILILEDEEIQLQIDYSGYYD